MLLRTDEAILTAVFINDSCTRLLALLSALVYKFVHDAKRSAEGWTVQPPCTCRWLILSTRQCQLWRNCADETPRRTACLEGLLPAAPQHVLGTRQLRKLGSSDCRTVSIDVLILSSLAGGAQVAWPHFLNQAAV